MDQSPGDLVAPPAVAAAGDVHPSRLLLAAGAGDVSRAWVLVEVDDEEGDDALSEL